MNFLAKLFNYSKNYKCKRTFQLSNQFFQFADPDPPESVTVTHNGTNRVLVTWNSPGCNGGPVRGVRVSMYPGDSRNATFFETNETVWNSSTGAGYFTITNYEFDVNVLYNWTVAVLYDSSNETIWSQESSAVFSKISCMQNYIHL